MRDLDELKRVNAIATHGGEPTQRDYEIDAMNEAVARGAFEIKYEAARAAERAAGLRPHDERCFDPVTGHECEEAPRSAVNGHEAFRPMLGE